MIQELLEKGSKEDQNDFEFKGKMETQRLLMIQMLGEKPAFDAELEWVSRYAEKVSEIIDNKEKYPDVRKTILEKKYNEAADLILKILKEEKLA